MTVLDTPSIPIRELTYEPCHECAPTEAIRPRKTSALKGWRVSCPVCASMLTAGKVVTDEPIYDIDPGGHTVRRRAYCGPCDRIISWIETATASGKPTHEIISGPGLSSGYTAEFLADHPEARWEDIR